MREHHSALAALHPRDDLYKHCFLPELLPEHIPELELPTAPQPSPRLGRRFGVIGCVRPAIGAIPPMAELQARHSVCMYYYERDYYNSGTDSIDL